MLEKYDQRKVVIVAREMPTEIGNSESIRLFRMIRMLAEKHIVFVYSEKISYGVSSIKTLGVNFGVFNDETILVEIIESINPDLVLFSRWINAENLIEKVREVTFAKVAIDIPSLTFEQLDNNDEIKNREFDQYKKCDFLMCTSKKIANVLKKHMIKQKIFIIYPIYVFDEYTRFLQNINKSQTYFVGDCTYGSNKEALKWFYNDVWKVIVENNKGLQLNLFGNFYPREYISNKNYNIKNLGFVPDMFDLMSTMSICYVPFKNVSGFSGKILEAIVYGIPIISTTKAAKPFEELGLKIKEHFYIADTPEEFSKRTTEVLENLDVAHQKTFDAKMILKAKLSGVEIKMNLFDVIESNGEKNSISYGEMDEYVET